MEDEELLNEIIWVMTHFGSDAGERANPGSKLQSQAERIVAFVTQRERAYELMHEHHLDLVKVVARSSR